MRVAIVGSRGWKNESMIKNYMSTLPKDTVIVSGGAQGVDTFAALNAIELGLNFKLYNADWETFGKSAGMLRNAKIVGDSDVVVAFWDGSSRGTKDTIDKALKADHIQQVIIFKEQKESAW